MMPEKEEPTVSGRTDDWRRHCSLEAFEAAWQRGERPAVEQYLPAGEAGSEVLLEFLHADLEHRLKTGEPARVEAYLERYPELIQDRSGVAMLIAWEYVLRRRREPDLAPHECLDRFPQFQRELLEQLNLKGPEREAPETPLPSLDSVRKQDEKEANPRSCAPASTQVGAWFIGKYRLVERLGSGGQGDVFRAIHPTLGRDVVIKLARESLPEFARQKLLDEGKVLARLDDPGLVRVYDVDLHEGRTFVVFEYVAGRSLAERLKQERPSFREAAALVAEIAGTLARLHARGVLHRDLKPANVLIDEAGRPRLLDFGLASLA
jgi:predicted Ser/Thr protein kinase